MIKVNEGEIKIEGNTFGLMADLSTIIHELNKILSEDFGKVITKSMLDKAISLGFMSEEELAKHAIELAEMHEKDSDEKMPNELRDLVNSILRKKK